MYTPEIKTGDWLMWGRCLAISYGNVVSFRVPIGIFVDAWGIQVATMDQPLQHL